MAVSPARMMTVANGSMCHVCTMMTENIASFGSPSHTGVSNGFTRCARTSTQLMTL